MAWEGVLYRAWPERGLYIGHDLGGDLYCAWLGSGFYIVHGLGGGSIFCMTRGVYIGHGPGVGSILGMAREGALCWAWSGRGL